MPRVNRSPLAVDQHCQRSHVERLHSTETRENCSSSGRDCGVSKFAGHRTLRRRCRGERGSTLILALAFLLIGSLLVTTLSSWTTNDLNNTSRFRNGQAALYAADGAAQLALYAARYTYPPASQLVSSTPSPRYSGACLAGNPVTINSLSMAALCTTVTNVGFSRLLTIEVFADPSGAVITSDPGTPPVLTATIGFVDNVAATGPAPYTCSAPPSSDCGTAMEIQSWKVQ